ncbi:hypothetical protein [Streptomyces millisiae]|uniref:Uncharacterized protein n=1 Tax=Streptomyces millisiae TaxID=3075542 RepID=A0ABU2LJQ1_9ACTN|nr:hypothetical protein [Streptomyces sp. DSM 44918]MDT0317720.1 hypothetical protein [Streptomyces sp. DSM 44918]
MTGLPTRMAVSIEPGTVVRYGGRWRTVKSKSLTPVGLGGLAAILVWEDGGATRVPCWYHLQIWPDEP